MFDLSNTMPKNHIIFKEDSINEVLEIPPENPSMESILNTIVSVKVENYKVINTEKMTSIEGQISLDIKLLVKLRLSSKMMYSSKQWNQPVQLFQSDSIKTMSIVVPNKISKEKINITPYVECVETRMLSDRIFQKCMLLFLTIDKD